MKYIYLIKNIDDSFYKIGITKHPNRRLKQLQTGNSSKLILISTFLSPIAHKIEKTLHNRYSYLKKEGEWFDFSINEEVNFIENCKNIEKSISFLINNNNVFI